MGRFARLGSALLGATSLVVLARCDSPDTDLSAVAGAPPPLALGYDAYTRWDRWPVLRIGTRTIMRSTFDRAGGNEASDASHFIRQSDHGFVTLDVAGSGVLAFVRTNRWHGSPWRYAVDGRATIVGELATADPDHAPAPSHFVPADLFPAPLAITWDATHGADLSWVRIPFETSFELAYGRTFYPTGYYILQMVPEGTTDLTAPLRAWDAVTPPPAEVLDLLTRAGTDVAPTAGVSRASGTVVVSAGPNAVTRLAGPGTLRALKLVVPRAAALAFGRASLRITWDGRDAPSVDAPVAQFFGAGTLYNRDGREWLVKAFPVSVRYPPPSPAASDAVVELATYFPMPFAREARIELVSDADLGPVTWEARWEPDTPREAWGYLHATFRDHGEPTPGRDLALLDTRGVEGSADWCGHVVGTAFTFSDRAVLSTLEGDPRFFFDDSQTPQVQGTGTEEWGGGGDYWSGANTTLPFAGHPTGAPGPDAARDPADLVEGAYRFLLGDAMPFGARAKLQLEHGGLDESTEHYRSVAFWYGWPEACLVQSDALHVSDLDDEARHAYVAVGASAPYAITSRYEIGVDHDGATELVPATTDTGRKVQTSSELTVQVPVDNAGLLLRRTLDYAAPDQRAEVFVADADTPGAPFARVGTWYTAGSSRAVFATAATETGPPTDVRSVDSGRRWRDDELLVPRHLTRGRTRLRFRFVVTPAGQPVRPGEPSPDGAWTEVRYAVYAWKVPRRPGP